MENDWNVQVSIGFFLLIQHQCTFHGPQSGRLTIYTCVKEVLQSTKCQEPSECPCSMYPWYAVTITGHLMASCLTSLYAVSLHQSAETDL